MSSRLTLVRSKIHISIDACPRSPDYQLYSDVVLEINGETCFDPKKVENCFNNFFTTVASNLVDKLPSSFTLFHTESSTFQNFYNSKKVQTDEFMLIPVSEGFIN